MTSKNFDALLKELSELDEAPRRRLLVKGDVLRPKRKPAPKPTASKQDLGLLIKSAVNDAVASGRLSGISAVAGLRALGLEP